MKPLIRIALVTALLLAITTVHAHAQSLKSGKWTGTVYPPDNDGINVTYDVRGEGAALAITMNDTPFGPIEFTDIKLTETSLEFSWFPGILLKCKLDKQDDGGYAGNCTDDSGVPGTVVMVPPK